VESRKSYITVRNITPAIDKALRSLQKQNGVTLNETVLQLLARSLGINQTKDNGLGRFSGMWDSDNFEKFHANIESLEKIDQDLWK